MKAWICTALDGPESLEWRDVDEPVPGPGEVLIETRACGLNFGDALKTHGAYQLDLPPPFVLGSEFAGVCVAVGQGVDDVAPGDRLNGMVPDGAFAERLVAVAGRCIAIPDHIPDTTAGGFYSGYLTAHYALVNRGALQAGETLLVLAAGGGTGLAAVDLGVALGAQVIAVAGSDEKLALAKERGAHLALNYKVADLEQALREQTGNRGVDVVFDPVGGDLFDTCCRRMAWGGRYLVVGFAAGRIPKFPVNLCLVKGFSLVGVFTDDYINREPVAYENAIADLQDMLRMGQLNPGISVAGELADLPGALSALHSGRALGKLVLERGG